MHLSNMKPLALFSHPHTSQGIGSTVDLRAIDPAIYVRVYGDHIMA